MAATVSECRVGHTELDRIPDYLPPAELFAIVQDALGGQLPSCGWMRVG